MAPSEAFLTACAQPVDRGAMAEIHVMNGAQEHAAVDDARRLAAEAEAEQREHARLVEGRKALHPVAVAVRDHAGVVGEPLRAIAVSPAAVVLQRLRQVPVIEAKPRLDARGDDCIDQPVVERKPGFVDRRRGPPA